jgi:molybdopterin-guanine dinucleotide biosynthesis protein A
MNMWEAIVLIVIVASVAKTIRARHQAMAHLAADRGHMQPVIAPAQHEALRREVEELRERIKVLERIATDGRASRNLADEIEALR